MNEKKIYKKFLNEAPPINIPSPEDGWEKMQRKLDQEKKERLAIRWKWFYTTAVILLLTGIGWFFQTEYLDNRSNLSKKIIILQSDSMAIALKKDLPKETVGSPGIKEKETNDSSAIVVKTNNSILSKQINIQYRQEKANNSSPQKKGSGKLYAIKPKTVRNTGSELKVIDDSKNERTSDTNIDSGKIKPDSDHKMTDTSSKKEETQNGTEVEKAANIAGKIIQAGLQWNAQLPLSSLRSYFAGPNGSSQPYRALLPGFWISVQQDKSLFTFQVNLFATAMLANKPFATTSTVNGADIILETNTLHKIFGTNAGFEFDYNIKDKWWLGGRVHGNFWRTGAATMKRENINTSSGSTFVTYENNYILKDSSWVDFTKFQIGTGFQLLYKLSKLQAGVSFDYYLLPLIDIKGQKNKTGVQIFARWPLFSKKN